MKIDWCKFFHYWKYIRAEWPEMKRCRVCGKFQHYRKGAWEDL
jgi:hypothetical protein